MTWLDTLKELAAEAVAARLAEVFPSGIPGEVTAAVLAEVDNIFAGEPVNLFNLRRLVVSITNETLAKVKEGLS